ncbi:MAG: peptidoglycan DD-metalloendopeptidase family protein [Acidobacteriota bacterium]|nr:peptidoglycan DD-metalloendopeptidase family protein [Acidobacteriota bacterium]
MLLLAQAGVPAPQNPDLDRIRADIAKLRNRLDEVRSKTKTAEQELEEVSIELDIRTREVEIAMRVESDLERQQRDLQSQIDSVAQHVAQQRDFLRSRLVSLYRLGRLSYVRLLLSIDERRDPIEAMSMLTYLASRDARAITRFNFERQQLRSRYAEMAGRQKKIVEARQVIQQRQQAVAATYARKEHLVASLRREGSKSEEQIATLEEKAKRLEHLIDVLSRQSAGATFQEDIRTVQGALGWPVEGKVVETFGKQVDPKFSTITFNNGLKIAAPAGADVHAVFPGTVLFSQWFKGYGNLMILDHGNRVFSLYGNLKAPAAAVGDHVTAGQTIAGVGEAEEARDGYLYFEIRQDNKPEDPQKWLR